ncbi:MAG: hypothetical protein QF449_16025 [Alphaproteobacteria bacterium]|jgi:hypothetical protein|nr:hypothetical protein [Alphaproteobacteria bacterium]MDP6588216.1 hypothetical protein [Alphaproteobacteria bacterium]MDP6819531.1 hypothetical protein [Alphaproteobacteria bacterium]|tara:strand:+ start:182 stop:337 length:156 start_codon:yes stop_codon:yes gene_type:complete
MSNQEPDSSSDYGWRESDGASQPRRSASHNLIAAIIVIGLISLLFWLKAVV